MYHAACKVEFEPFNRLYSQLTFFIFYKVLLRLLLFYRWNGSIHSPSTNLRTVLVFIAIYQRSLHFGESACFIRKERCTQHFIFPKPTYSYPVSGNVVNTLLLIVEIQNYQYIFGKKVLPNFCLRIQTYDIMVPGTRYGVFNPAAVPVVVFCTVLILLVVFFCCSSCLGILVPPLLPLLLLPNVSTSYTQRTIAHRHTAEHYYGTGPVDLFFQERRAAVLAEDRWWALDQLQPSISKEGMDQGWGQLQQQQLSVSLLSDFSSHLIMLLVRSETRPWSTTRT